MRGIIMYSWASYLEKGSQLFVRIRNSESQSGGYERSPET